MASLIDLETYTVNKEEFQKVASLLEGNLKKIIVPNGRQYVTFTAIPQQYSIEQASNDALEEDILSNRMSWEDNTSTNFRFQCPYHISHITNLYDEWQQTVSSNNGHTHHISIFQFPAAVRFTTLLRREIANRINQICKENKLLPAINIELDFDKKDPSVIYTDFLTIDLTINIMQIQ